MSGTSRSLIRALENVFDTWDKSVDWDVSPPAGVRELYNTVDAYNSRHNSINSMSSTINDDLRTTYNDYIRNASDLSHETFFVELLTRLLPMLTLEEVRLWLKTYLRPALDSAGFELKFVAKTRNFVRALTNDVLHTDDKALLLRRRAIADAVMGDILRIYIGNDQKAYDLIDLNVSEEEQDTHIHAERIRFVERNAADLISEWGSKNPKQFFSLVNAQYCVAKLRLKALTIASHVVSKCQSQLLVVMDTPFFINLLRSLTFDFSETLVASAFYTLLMILGKICNRLSSRLPDLLMILSRLLLWKSCSAQSAQLEESSLKFASKTYDWDTVYADSESTVMQASVFSDGEFNVLHFFTILYGLFPANVMLFCNKPYNYLLKNPSKLLPGQHLDLVGLTEKSLIRLSESLTKMISRLMLHPNIMKQVSASQELANPIKWILEQHNNEDVGEESVVLACLRLNPDIILSVPDNLLLPSSLLQKIASTNNFPGDFADRRNGEPATSNTSLHVSLFPNSARGSFQLSFEGLQLGPVSAGKFSLPSHWQNADRKMSIVPTNLVMTGAKDNEKAHEGLQFKNVDFNGPSVNTDKKVAEVEVDEKAPGFDLRNSLGDLYSAQERLFTTTAVKNNVNSLTPTATANFQQSSGTASDLLSKQLKREANLETTKDVVLQFSGAETLAPGSALDFYQRELLLMKNELEFSSYMKHLNKFRYLKSKLRYNRVKRAEENGGERTSERNGLSDRGLQEELNQLRLESEQAIKEKTAEVLRLFDRLKELQKATSQSDAKINYLERELSTKDSQLQAARADSMAARAELQAQMCRLKVMEKPEVPRPEAPPEAPNVDLPVVNGTEKALVDAELEVKMLKEAQRLLQLEVDKIREELDYTVRSYEKQLSSIKLSIGEQVREQSVHYERKIQELNMVIVKFESALEEKNARITQLSTTKPIRIPETMDGPARANFYVGSTRPNHKPRADMEAARGMHEYYRDRRSTTSTESLSLGSVPSVTALRHAPVPSTLSTRHNSNVSIPIVKGRGGYQKRAKKTM